MSNRNMPQFNYNAGMPQQSPQVPYNNYPHYLPPQAPYYQQAPYQQQQMQQAPQAQQNVSNVQLAYINGIEGAKAYVVVPKQSVCLLDDENSMMYFKEADEQGKATLKAFKMSEIDINEINKPINASEFVTRKEFDELIMQLKSAFPQPVAPTEGVK